MGGYVFGVLDRAPEPDDEVEQGGLRFKVLDVDGTRIERLEIEFLPMLEQERTTRSAGRRRLTDARPSAYGLHRLRP